MEPYIPAVHNKLTENLQPHPTLYPGYVNLNRPLPLLKPGFSFTWQEDTFHVGDLIGEGGFAKVYGGVWENGPLEERDTVLKIQSPANDWEWYILNQVRAQSDPSGAACSNIVLTVSVEAGRPEASSQDQS